MAEGFLLKNWKSACEPVNSFYPKRLVFPSPLECSKLNTCILGKTMLEQDGFDLGKSPVNLFFFFSLGHRIKVGWARCNFEKSG